MESKRGPVMSLSLYICFVFPGEKYNHNIHHILVL